MEGVPAITPAAFAGTEGMRKEDLTQEIETHVLKTGAQGKEILILEAEAQATEGISAAIAEGLGSIDNPILEKMSYILTLS